MTEAEIRNLVEEALSDIAPEVNLTGIDPDQDLRSQMDLDSVDFLNFVIALHTKLKVEIPDADAPRLATLNGCIGYLSSKTAKG